MSETLCSVIIPTIGRATLTRAVESVLDQVNAQHPTEVIVVNDSGKPLPEAAWQRSPQARTIHTQRRRLCVARNSGAAVAHGRYLHFLDDDDWLMPGAVRELSTLAAHYPEAGCLFGSFELVDDAGTVISRHHVQAKGNLAAQLVCGSWLQVAAVWIRGDVFYAAGGFSPLLTISEEIDLFNRIAMSADFYGDDAVVAQIQRGNSWQSTVDYSRVYEFNRWVRDRALDIPGAYDRLQSSASDGYWRGRILRVYMLSWLWNWFRKGRFFTGLSRGIHAFRSLFAARGKIVSAAYWLGVTDHSPRI